VLNNLIVNATKFTPDGGSVLLAVHMKAHEETGILDFVVSDTGIGIPPNEVDKIKNR
jgi:signal transduction histidine kinase